MLNNIISYISLIEVSHLASHERRTRWRRLGGCLGMAWGWLDLRDGDGEREVEKLGDFSGTVFFGRCSLSKPVVFVGCCLVIWGARVGHWIGKTKEVDQQNWGFGFHHEIIFGNLYVIQVVGRGELLGQGASKFWKHIHVMQLTHPCYATDSVNLPMRKQDKFGSNMMKLGFNHQWSLTDTTYFCFFFYNQKKGSDHELLCWIFP